MFNGSNSTTRRQSAYHYLSYCPVFSLPNLIRFSLETSIGGSPALGVHLGLQGTSATNYSSHKRLGNDIGSCRRCMRMVKGIICRHRLHTNLLVRLCHIRKVIHVCRPGALRTLLRVPDESWRRSNRRVGTIPDVVRCLGGDDRCHPFGLERSDGVLDVEREAVDQDRCPISSHHRRSGIIPIPDRVLPPIIRIRRPVVMPKLNDSKIP